MGDPARSPAEDEELELMSTLSIDCACGKRLAVKQELMGKRVRCPNCSAVLDVKAETPPETADLICGCGQPLSVPASLRGKRVCCPKCSQEIAVPESQQEEQVADPFANLDTASVAVSPSTPPTHDSPAYQPPTHRAPAQQAPSYQNPLGNQSVGGSVAGFRNYADVPWIRKSGTNSVFLILHLLTCGLIPLLLITCVVLVTGNVYYNEREASGNLKAWSVANKIIAFLLLIPSVLVIGTFGMAFVGGMLRAMSR